MFSRPFLLRPLERQAKVLLFREISVQQSSSLRLSALKSSNVPCRVFSQLSAANKLRGGSRLTLFTSNKKIHPHATSLLYPPSMHLGAVTYFSSYGGGGGKRPSGNRLAQGAGLIGAAGVLLGKSKYILGALKLTKVASLGSMVMTIGTYSMFFGLPYAVGMVGLILVHETGHMLVMLQRGIPFSPMVFMPFVGAAIAMRRMPRDAWEDALVAFGGPVLGSVGAGAVAIGAHMTNSQLLYSLAHFGGNVMDSQLCYSNFWCFACAIRLLF